MLRRRSSRITRVESAYHQTRLSIPRQPSAITAPVPSDRQRLQSICEDTPTSARTKYRQSEADSLAGVLMAAVHDVHLRSRKHLDECQSGNEGNAHGRMEEEWGNSMLARHWDLGGKIHQSAQRSKYHPTDNRCLYLDSGCRAGKMRFRVLWLVYRCHE